jgi:hypothetical protein
MSFKFPAFEIVTCNSRILDHVPLEKLRIDTSAFP